MSVLQTFDLTIGYSQPRQPDLRIAEGLNLTVKKGELVCLLGPNGAGKSTLMRTIAGMQKPLAGNIHLSGNEVHSLSARELAKRLSIVLTERPNLGLMNGYALVALGRHPYTDWSGRLTPYDEAVIRWAVEAVGAADIAQNPVMELSDGQRQKLLIARALAQEPELILLDEPTAFLDLPRRVEMMRLLKFLARHTQRAILLSTHDLDLALRTADTLWLLSNGEIQAGTPEDLVLNGALERAFQSEGVEFDRLTGAFRVAERGKALVVLEGDGIPLIWTRRALEREGYGVISRANGIPPIAVIQIEGDEQHPTWCVRIGERQSLHSHISGLIAELKEHSTN